MYPIGSTYNHLYNNLFINTHLISVTRLISVSDWSKLITRKYALTNGLKHTMGDHVSFDSIHHNESNEVLRVITMIHYSNLPALVFGMDALMLFLFSTLIHSSNRTIPWWGAMLIVLKYHTCMRSEQVLPPVGILFEGLWINACGYILQRYLAKCDVVPCVWKLELLIALHPLSHTVKYWY